MSIYTYSIFDSNPNSSSGDAWPDHSDVEIEADSDDEVVEEVAATMACEASALNVADGYSVGQVLYALVWDEDGTVVGTPTYTVTAEDLGVDDEDVDLAALERARNEESQ